MTKQTLENAFHKIVLQPNNHMKKLQHEFHSGSDGFPCFDFPRLLLEEVFPLEWRRNRLKHSLAKKKEKKFR